MGTEHVKTRLPVRSALFRVRTGGLEVRWVTTSESPMLLFSNVYLAIRSRGSYELLRADFFLALEKTFLASLDLLQHVRLWRLMLSFKIFSTSSRCIYSFHMEQAPAWCMFVHYLCTSCVTKNMITLSSYNALVAVRNRSRLSCTRSRASLAQERLQ
jgi:hypothetical protein